MEDDEQWRKKVMLIEAHNLIDGCKQRVLYAVSCVLLFVVAQRKRHISRR